MQNLSVPQHIGCIMDGNRRWARSRNLSTKEGHRAGLENLKNVARHAAQQGVKILTVYTLSAENIKERSGEEVGSLWELIEMAISEYVQALTTEAIHIRCIGDLAGIPKHIHTILQTLQASYVTMQPPKLICNLAINYGGRQEMVSAVKKIVAANTQDIHEKTIADNLYTAGLPDPEMIIRTGGRSRISNFLLWQAAYAELYFSPLMWPDFTPQELDRAIIWYQEQTRNFGK